MYPYEQGTDMEKPNFKHKDMKCDLDHSGDIGSKSHTQSKASAKVGHLFSAGKSGSSSEIHVSCFFDGTISFWLQHLYFN